MAKLQFDQVGSRIYETGVNNGVLFKMNSQGTYGTGVAWNGLTSIEESPEGAEETAIYADNIKYLSLRSKENFGATINAYTYPDAWGECDGSKTIGTGVTVGQQSRSTFALVYKTVVGNDVSHEDYGYKIHIIYNATASVSSKSHTTINDSPEAIEFSWEIKSTPISVNIADTKPLSTLVIDSTKFTSAELKTKLTAIENMIYGTDPTVSPASEGTDPTLPTPEQILAIINATSNTNNENDED